jgi:hypothetical protein
MRSLPRCATPSRMKTGPTTRFFMRNRPACYAGGLRRFFAEGFNLGRGAMPPARHSIGPGAVAHSPVCEDVPRGSWGAGGRALANVTTLRNSIPFPVPWAQRGSFSARAERFTSVAPSEAQNTFATHSGIDRKTFACAGRPARKVPCDEGVAIRIGPESCAVAREGPGEASSPGIEPGSGDRRWWHG